MTVSSSFHALFSLHDRAVSALLSHGLQTLSFQQRVELEIPVIAATLEELTKLRLELKHKPELTSEQLEQKLNALQYYCFFVGYPRSGHSILGSLLDAHPDMCIAHELNVFNLLDKQPLSAAEIYQLIVKNSVISAACNNQWGEYSYHVDGQFQGKTNSIKVIGDKKGGNETAQLLTQKPHLLDSLYREFKKPIKIIHVVRNPFDNIATIHKKHSLDQDTAIKLYAALCHSNSVIIKRMKPSHVLTLKHEQLISDPENILAQAIHFFDLQASTEYLHACTNILYENPHQSRKTLEWTSEQRMKIEHIIAQYDFLKGYTFGD